MWGLEIVDWDDVVMKLPSLLPVSADDGSEQKISDASIVNLNGHLIHELPCWCRRLYFKVGR